MGRQLSLRDTNSLPIPNTAQCVEEVAIQHVMYKSSDMASKKGVRFERGD